MSIPDKAVEAGKEAVEAAAEEKKRFEEDTWVEGFAGDFARAALEAAEPYLTGESRLREALTDLIEARTNHSSPYPSDYVIEPNELRELLAATLEVKS